MCVGRLLALSVINRLGWGGGGGQGGLVVELSSRLTVRNILIFLFICLLVDCTNKNTATATNN